MENEAKLEDEEIENLVHLRIRVNKEPKNKSDIQPRITRGVEVPNQQTKCYRRKY